MCRFRIRLAFFQILFMLIAVYKSIDIFIKEKSLDARHERFCFANRTLFKQESSADCKQLKDILKSEACLQKGNNIFFHQTSCDTPQGSNFENFCTELAALLGLTTLTRYAYLHPRQACAMESAARHHPNHTVMMTFVCAEAWHPTANLKLLNALNTYSNIRFSKLSVWCYAAGTPMESFLHMGKLFESEYMLSHMSDFLRFLSLWRWGGLYLDLDVVVLKTLAHIEPNFAAKETREYVGSSVLHMKTSGGVGYVVAEMCLKRFRQNFSTDVWGANGPDVITEVLQNLCRVSDIAQMNEETCFGFKVLPPKAFYAIPWRKWREFYATGVMNETLLKLEDAYVAHVWHSATHGALKVPLANNQTAYGQLAAKNCPKVYAASKYSL